MEEQIKALLQELLSEDHNILLKISTQMEILIETQRDHEKRIRMLERVVMYGLGGLGAAKIVFDLVSVHK